MDNQGNALGLFQDALGNLKAILSSTNTHWIEELPSPYGPTGPPPTLEPNLLSFAKSHTWQGNRLDPTGLIHLGARHYDPKVGRFLSPDPISFPTCLDLYTYANSDPINFRDPSGRYASSINDTIIPSTISALRGAIHGAAEYVHPIGEFTLGGIDFFGSLASHVGASDLGFSTTERLAAIPHIEAARVNRWDTLDRALLGSFSNADPSDTIYHNFRNGTRKGIDLGLAATAGYGLAKVAVKGTLNFLQSNLFRLSNLNFEASVGRSALSLNRGAESINAGINLTKKLSQLEKMQISAVRTRLLSDGRIRYYGLEKPASTQGLTRGATNVLEWNPNTGNVRSWYECYDHLGDVNRVHPKSINGQTLSAPHYPPIAAELK